MRRLCVLVCLLAGAGCMSDDAVKHQLADAAADARGDNMRMRGNMTKLDDSTDTPNLRPKN